MENAILIYRIFSTKRPRRLIRHADHALIDFLQFIRASS